MIIVLAVAGPSPMCLFRRVGHAVRPAVVAMFNRFTSDTNTEQMRTRTKAVAA